ncbi:MAG: PepSY domain-containing protein [Betaproteobacteria bacterium]|nr:MAG: PepSY domain-containing protein [Betaproteobacteria bacterium]
MNKATLSALSMLIVAFLFGGAHAREAMPKTKVSMEDCMFAALEKQSGEIKEVELELEDGVPRYDFEIEGVDGRTAEVECDAMTGAIVEVEWENDDMDVDAFLQRATVTPAQARKIALQRVPGRVSEINLETSSTGEISYEFEIITRDGTQADVEVNALTGRVVEVERDVYEIGD